MKIKEQDFNLVSTDGTILKGYLWKPADNNIKATLSIIHGIGEYSLRYSEFAEQFCREGIMVYSFDLRGHGYSEGKRGHVNSLNEYYDDISTIVRRSKRNWGDVPGFIYGHSMGGNLLLSYLMHMRQDFAGAIVSSPWLELYRQPGSFLLKAGALLDHIIPEVTFKTGLKAKDMTSVKSEKKRSKKDKLIHKKITLRLFNELYNSSIDIMNYPFPVEIPLFIIHGEDDRVTRSLASETFAGYNPDLFDYKKYKNGRHELHRDGCRVEVINDIINWIDDVLKSRK
ncbi:lysophospholipase [Marinilabiliaceae bacterium ANBcel2]|nr:lysophospholipase [Marinilabiliaceae bacterium ANBcel2]